MMGQVKLGAVIVCVEHDFQDELIEDHASFTHSTIVSLSPPFPIAKFISHSSGNLQ